MKLTLLVSFGCLLIVATLAQQENERREVDPEASIMLQELDGMRQKTRPPGQRELVTDPDNIRVRVPHTVIYHSQLDDDDGDSDIELKQKKRPRPVYVSMSPQRVTQEIRYYRDPRPSIVTYPVAGDALPNPDNIRLHRVDPKTVVYYQDQLDEDKNELGIQIKVSLNNQDLTPIKRPLPRPTPLHQSQLYLTDNTQQLHTL